LTTMKSMAFPMFVPSLTRSRQKRLLVAVLPVPTLPMRKAVCDTPDSSTGRNIIHSRSICFSLWTSFSGT